MSGLGSYCNAAKLVFNQVLLYSPAEQTTYTVPAGRVWKVVSAWGSSTQMSRIYWSDSITISIGRVNTSANHFLSQFPVWLPAGARVRVGRRMGVSILEYLVE